MLRTLLLFFALAVVMVAAVFFVTSGPPIPADTRIAYIRADRITTDGQTVLKVAYWQKKEGGREERKFLTLPISRVVADSRFDPGMMMWDGRQKVLVYNPRSIRVGLDAVGQFTHDDGL